MKKKKIVLIIILFVLTVTLTLLLIFKNDSVKDDSELLIQSNKRDESKEQFKVLNEYINIRLENDTKSEIIGKVYKDEIYTILDKKEDEYYEWYLIETSNELKGYVAVKYLEDIYIEELEMNLVEEVIE